ncbi:girdin [Platysternon megacephalum]|uniref:Girdin n=1 Tax=Platysternon megacephalum TaxID=55544 RepID=A0A4D9DR59_9SAUR|nr:girdin [Platysternon megacephalum]
MDAVSPAGHAWARAEGRPLNSGVPPPTQAHMLLLLQALRLAGIQPAPPKPTGISPEIPRDQDPVTVSKQGLQGTSYFYPRGQDPIHSPAGGQDRLVHQLRGAKAGATASVRHLPQMLHSLSGCGFTRFLQQQKVTHERPSTHVWAAGGTHHVE